jgi:hypothetical protein
MRSMYDSCGIIMESKKENSPPIRRTNAGCPCVACRANLTRHPWLGLGGPGQHRRCLLRCWPNELTDNKPEELADRHLPQGMCPAHEEPGMIRACARIEQLRRREGLEVAYPVFPFHRRSYCRIRVTFSKKWHRLFGFHLLHLFRDGGPRTNPLTDEQLSLIARSPRVRFPRQHSDPPILNEQVN